MHFFSLIEFHLTCLVHLYYILFFKKKYLNYSNFQRSFSNGAEQQLALWSMRECLVVLPLIRNKNERIFLSFFLNSFLAPFGCALNFHFHLLIFDTGSHRSCKLSLRCLSIWQITSFVSSLYLRS
jgi:hypothetical protein